MTDFGSQPPADQPPPPPPFGRGPDSPMPPPPPISMTAPPGYMTYGGTGTPFAFPLRRVAGVAKALVIVQSIGVVGAAISLLLQLTVLGSARDYVNGDLSQSQFQDDIAPFLLFGSLIAAVSIATLVLLVLWSYRIASNIQQMQRPLTWKPGLTIVVWILGGCTLSIINFLMLREHWRASDPESSPGVESSSATPPLIISWFVLSLVQVAVGLVSGVRSFSGITVGNQTDDLASSLADRSELVIVSGVVSIAAAVVLIMIIRRMTTRHIAATREA